MGDEKRVDAIVKEKLNNYTKEITAEMEDSVSNDQVKAQFENRAKTGASNKVKGIGSIMRSKAKTDQKEKEKCEVGAKFGPVELQKKKKDFCLGYQHLDLSTSN